MIMWKITWSASNFLDTGDTYPGLSQIDTCGKSDTLMLPRLVEMRDDFADSALKTLTSQADIMNNSPHLCDWRMFRLKEAVSNNIMRENSE